MPVGFLPCRFPSRPLTPPMLEWSCRRHSITWPSSSGGGLREDGIVQQVHAGVAMIRRNLSQRGFLPPNPDYTDLPKLLQQCARQILNQLEAKMGLAQGGRRPDGPHPHGAPGDSQGAF